MRVWLAKEGMWTEERARVWVELGEGRMLWILNDGRHGVSADEDGWGDAGKLSDRLTGDPEWEEL